MIDGKGSGQGRKLSVNIPAYVRTSIKLGIVYKFDKDGVSSTLNRSLMGNRAPP